MLRDMRGFTLIELMIVVAIIAILSAVALPAYNNYRKGAAESACMAEAKGFANEALVKLYVGNTPGAAVSNACLSIVGGTVIGDAVTGTPKSPGTRTVTCEMDGDSAQGSCTLN